MEKNLRIGNLVFIDNPKSHPRLEDTPLEVTGINPCFDFPVWTYSVSLKHINQKPNTYYETYSQFIKFIKPIQLTEEWLLKVGFERVKARSGVARAYKLGCIRLNMSTCGNFYRYKLSIDYIHELQNLYFALTQTELTIK